MTESSPNPERHVTVRTFFPTLEEFYDAEPLRRQSPEADYGVMWRTADLPAAHRVSYVRYTGEIYAVQLNNHMGPVHLLGKVPPDNVDNERTQLYYQTLENILTGWPEQSIIRNNLKWITDQLHNAGYPAYPPA